MRDLRLRPPHPLLPLPRWTVRAMRCRQALIAVLISAQLAGWAHVEEVRDLLRQAAVKAGCSEPRVYMRWPDDDGLLTIVVSCPKGATE